MSLLALLAVSLAPSPAVLPPSLAYGCVVAGEASPSCAASPMRVAGGKGTVPAVRTRAAAPKAVAAACHSDPSKGRACRHHKIQAEAQQTDGALALREDVR